MPHVDEGLLHAYLDGVLNEVAAGGALPDGRTVSDVAAHIDGCAQCSARLEQERMLRDRAALVLHDAGAASVDVPPFEMLTPYADAGVAARRRSSGLPLAWAASVLLALGAGWWGSEQWRGGSVASHSEPVRPEVAADAVQPQPAAPVAGVAEAVAPADAAGGGQAGGRAAVQRGVVSTEAAAAGPAASARTGVVAAESEAARSSEAGAAAERIQPQVQQIAVQPLIPRDAVGLTTRATLDSMTVQGTRLPFTVARVGSDALATSTQALSSSGAAVISPGTLAPPPPAPPAPRPGVPPVSRAAQGAVGFQSFAAGAAPAQALERFRSYVEAARAGRLSFTPAPAPATVGVTVLGLEEGTGTARIEVAALQPAGSLVRVVQPLDTGETIELLLWRDPALLQIAALSISGKAAAVQSRAVDEQQRERAATHTLQISSGRLPDGTSEVVVRVPAVDAFVALRGRVSVDALERLAGSLVPLR